MSDSIAIKKATKKDIPSILHFIKALSVYEKMDHLVKANEERLEKALFEDNLAEVLLASYHGKVVGFALYYKTFSTFACSGNIYLEDLFVEEAYRGKGIGKALLKELALITKSSGYTRLEWSCLDWNTPSIEFYKSIGAKQKDAWVYFRLENEALEAFIRSEKKG